MYVEIRNYHYDPAKFEPYRQWAVDEAIPFLKENLDVVGFWLSNGDEPEISGSDPMSPALGPANVTWIINWASREARQEGFQRVFGGEGWRRVWANHPDPDGYRQIEARFMEEV